MIFYLHLVLDVTATPPGASLLDAADQFMEELHALSNQDDRLDCTVGVEADTASTGRIEVDLAVEASTMEHAFPAALSWVRTALHAAHVPTPGWDVGVATVRPCPSPEALQPVSSTS
jgi:hypothetical protein